MNSAPGSFFNGRTPVPEVVWNLSFNLSSVANDSKSVASNDDFKGTVGVNNDETAATLVGGKSPAARPST